MQVYVRTPVGALKLQVNPSDNLLSLKQKIQAQQGQYIEAMVLQYKGITLENQKRIQDYGIPNQAEIFLILQQIQVPQAQVFKPMSIENVHMVQPTQAMAQGHIPQGQMGYMPQEQMPYGYMPQGQMLQGQIPQTQLQYPQQQNHKKHKSNKNQGSTFISHMLNTQEVDGLSVTQNVVVAKIAQKKKKIHSKMQTHLEECKHEECKEIFTSQPCNMNGQQFYNNVKMPLDYRIGFKK